MRGRVRGEKGGDGGIDRKEWGEGGALTGHEALTHLPDVVRDVFELGESGMKEGPAQVMGHSRHTHPSA